MAKITGVLSFIWKLYNAVIFLITAIFYYPIITPLLFSEKNKKFAFKMFVAWSWTFRLLCFYHVRTNKHTQLPEGPYIIIGNHISYLDIFLLYSVLPKHPFLFLGKSEILKYPLIKTYFKRLNIPVYRGNRQKSAQALMKAKREINNGWSLVIFPEGGIPDEHNPKMVRFKDGAFQLAKSMNIPLLPISFLNNHLLFSDPTKILGPARPGISKMIIHPFIRKETVANLEVSALRKMCKEIIEAPLLEVYPHLKE